MQSFGIGRASSNKVVNKRFDPYVYVDSNSSGHARMLCKTPVPVFSQLRKHETMTLTVGWGGGLHKSGQRGEYFSCLARMFEPVLRPGSFGLIAHDFGEPQGGQNITDARDASTCRFGDLARVHLFTFSQETDDRKGNGIPQEPT